jgi:dTMP kinase
MPEAQAGRGRLIALEGIDGAGTTTQARLLADWLSDHGAPASLTREPSGGPLGLLLRDILSHRTREVDRAALALLFAADRLDHLAAEVEPLLGRGGHVVTDRYVYSSLAYQSMDLDLPWVAAINRRAPEPDLTIYLRVDPAVAARRRSTRDRQAEVFETNAEQQRIASIYDAFFGSTAAAGSWRLDPGGSDWIPVDPARIRPELGRVGRAPCWAVVDGEQPVDHVHSRLKKLVRKICPVT